MLSLLLTEPGDVELPSLTELKCVESHVDMAECVTAITHSFTHCDRQCLKVHGHELALLEDAELPVDRDRRRIAC